MTPLLQKFRADQFDFTLLQRQGDVALFSKTKPHFTRTFYEVVIVQRRPDHTWPNGTTTPAHEAMPPSKSWGTYGWGYGTLGEAERKFSELVSQRLAKAA